MSSDEYIYDLVATIGAGEIIMLLLCVGPPVVLMILSRRLDKQIRADARPSETPTATTGNPENDRAELMDTAADDEHVYEQVAAELEAGNRKEGLWLKAETEADGDAAKTKSLYVKWRVEQLLEKEGKQRVGAKEDERASVSQRHESTVQTHSATSRERAEEEWVAQSNKTGAYASVGGWLLVFCITLVMCTPLRSLSFVVQYNLSVDNVAREIRYQRNKKISVLESERLARESIATMERNPALSKFLAWIKVEMFIITAVAVFSFICGCGLLARRSWALKWVKIYLWSGLGCAVLSFLAALYLDNPTISNLPGGNVTEEGFKVLLQSGVYFGIWYTYLKKSKRVKGTFPDYVAH